MGSENQNKRSRTELESENEHAKDDMLKEILETVKSNKSQLNDLSGKLDTFEARYNDLSIKYEDLEHKHTELNEKYEELLSDNIDLHNKYMSVNKSIDRINQQSLNSNIEIAGVPELDSETPTDIAATIFKNLGFPDEKIIKSAYRRNTKNTIAGLPKNIIVSIKDKGDRDRILAKSRKIKNLNTSILEENYNPVSREKSTDPQNSNSNVQLTENDKNSRPIYLNEHLTDFNKYLLARSKNLRRSGKVFMVYARNGFVIVRIEASSPEIRIQSVAQLDGIIDQQHTQPQFGAAF